LRAALDTLVANESPLFARLQEATVSQLVDDYVKARKDYTNLKKQYTDSSVTGSISRELMAKFNAAQRLRDQKSKELKQLTGLGALGMIEKYLLVFNARLESNLETLAALGVDSEQEIEKTDDLAKSLRTLIQDFKNRELGVIKLKFSMTQVENPEGNDTLDSFVTLMAIGGDVGTDSESIVGLNASPDSESLSGGIDEVGTGIVGMATLDADDSTTTRPEIVREVQDRTAGIAKSVYSAAASLFSPIRAILNGESK